MDFQQSNTVSSPEVEIISSMIVEVDQPQEDDSSPEIEIISCNIVEVDRPQEYDDSSPEVEIIPSPEGFLLSSQSPSTSSTSIDLIYIDSSDENDEPAASRHCAQCLKEVSTDQVQMCGGCNRRAYCSNKCRGIDWVPGRGSQGHQVWCDLECGEEDIDWEIKKVQGKSIGLYAKLPIKRLSRIMVDPSRKKTHPQVQYLEPFQGTIDQKNERNQFIHVVRDPVVRKMYFLCVRLSRANHDCHPNAGFALEPDTMVGIMYAERDIAQGEEIRIRYKSFNAMTNYEWSNDNVHHHIATMWGTICPPTHICQRPEILRMVSETRKLYEIVKRAIANNELADQGLNAVKTLMENYDRIDFATISKLLTLRDAVSLAVMKYSTLDLAKSYAKEFWEMFSSIYRPGSELFRNNQQWATDLKLHPNYLTMERVVLSHN